MSKISVSPSVRPSVRLSLCLNIHLCVHGKKVHTGLYSQTFSLNCFVMDMIEIVFGYSTPLSVTFTDVRAAWSAESKSCAMHSSKRSKLIRMTM